MWVIRVPFAAFMTPHFGSEAIWWSFPLGTITSSILTALYFQFGGWRNSRMLEPVRPPGAPAFEAAVVSGEADRPDWASSIRSGVASFIQPIRLAFARYMSQPAPDGD